MHEVFEAIAHVSARTSPHGSDEQQSTLGDRCIESFLADNQIIVEDEYAGVSSLPDRERERPRSKTSSECIFEIAR